MGSKDQVRHIQMLWQQLSYRILGTVSIQEWHMETGIITEKLPELLQELVTRARNLSGEKSEASFQQTPTKREVIRVSLYTQTMVWRQYLNWRVMLATNTYLKARIQLKWLLELDVLLLEKLDFRESFFSQGITDPVENFDCFVIISPTFNQWNEKKISAILWRCIYGG